MIFLQLTYYLPHVPLEFTEFHTGVITLGTFMRFLERVSVSDVSDEFPAGRECRITFLTFLWSDSGVRVDVILKRRDCLETAITNITLVGALLENRFKIVKNFEKKKIEKLKKIFFEKFRKKNF